MSNIQDTIKNCATELCSKYKIKSLEDISSILSNHFSNLTQSTTSNSTISNSSSNSSSGCTTLMKSGERKNQPCGATVVSGTNSCKRHTAKDTSTVAPIAKTPKTVKDTKEPKEPKVAKKSSALDDDKKPIFDVIEKRRTLFHIMKNKFENFEHKETGFIFDPKTDEVIGKQHSDGTIIPLSVNDIELCKENNWSFKVSTKLTPSSTSSTVKKQTVIVEDDDGDSDEEYEEEMDE
jgi:hypothetical protein